MAVDIYPVVHIGNHSKAADIAVEQVAKAIELSASGVYLIDHNSDATDQLLRTYQLATNAFADFFIGVNFLQYPSAQEGFAEILKWQEGDLINKLPSGLWCDRPHNLPEKTAEIRDNNPQLYSITYLGGVASKYTVHFTDDPEKARAEAILRAPLVDVVVTTGAETGKATNPQKVTAIKQAIGDKQLALASGVSAENLHLYAAADQVLVSTSIETSPGSGIFDSKALKQLISAAKQIKRATI